MRKSWSFYLVFTTFLIQGLFAEPSGFNITSGEATVSRNGKNTLVKNSDRAIIHWDDFSIQSDETLHFLQENGQSRVLNRVTGKNPSEIHGTLTSNGQVFLVNQNGVLVGPSGYIKTAGFVVSSFDIPDADFLNKDVLILPEDSEQFAIRIDNTSTETIANLKKELSSGGNPYEKAIRHSDTKVALQGKEENGRIYLTTENQDIKIAGTLSTEHGELCVLGKNIQIEKTASLDVSSKLGGGHIHIGKSPAFENSSSSSVTIESGAVLSANAIDHGQGGKIFIWSDDEMRCAGHLSVRGGSQSGSAGFVSICAPGNSYRFNGTLDLHAPRGEAGILFIDPKNVYIQPDGTGSATGNTFSSNPTQNATISGQTLSSALNSGSVVIQANNDIVIEDDITATTSGSGLTLQAGRSIFNVGSIELNNGAFSATINDPGAEAADRDAGSAVFNLGNQSFAESGLSSIKTNGGNISLNVGNFGGSQEGQLIISNASVIDAGGGNIQGSGFGSASAPMGMILSNATIQTSGTGTIGFYAHGFSGPGLAGGIQSTNCTFQTESGSLSVSGIAGGESSQSNLYGIYTSQTTFRSTNGGIAIFGNGGPGTSYNSGVCLNDNTHLITENGSISVSGLGSGSQKSNPGVLISEGSTITSSGSSTIELKGTGGNGSSYNQGILFTGVRTKISATDGSVLLEGNGNGMGIFNEGIRMQSSAQIESTGNATITLKGTASSGTDDNMGVILSNCPIKSILSVSGDISITGVGKGSQTLNQGVRLENGQIVSTGTDPNAASITVNGTGGDGTIQNYGIFLGTKPSCITSVDGDINLTGVGKTGPQNWGIYISVPGSVNATGTGNVSIDSSPPPPSLEKYFN